MAEFLVHRIYTLERPLRPGDSLKLEFEVRYDPPGFPVRDIDASLALNGTYFWTEWLPAVGYQRGREHLEGRLSALRASYLSPRSRRRPIAPCHQPLPAVP